ncbi:hypothetical protein Tsubulata_042515, partial [Turnera subulata]
MLQNAEKKSIDELLSLNPLYHQDKQFHCEAKIVDIDLRMGWYYKACHTCYKQLDETSGAKICPKHGIIEGLPLPWYKMHLIVADEDEQTTFVLMGTAAERTLHVTCYNLVYEQEQKNPSVAPEIIANLIGKTKIFQIRFGQQKSTSSRFDFLISNVFDIPNKLASGSSIVSPATTVSNPAGKLKSTQ